MVDWTSPAELQADSAAFNNLVHAFFGLYIWEFVTSFNFEWMFLTGKKKFKWPLIFYFAGRYCLMSTFIVVVVALNVRTEIDCQVLYIFVQLFGNATVGLVSINLSIRTMAVWSDNKYIVGFLVLVILGHWSILLCGILVKAVWMDGTCVITYTNSRMFALSFIYSMTFDFTVLCLTAWKLLFGATGRSRLVRLIFGDGLIYFIIAFVVNAVATVFMLLDLNVVMSIIVNLPAATISTIVASRVVRRLTNFAAGPGTFGPTVQSTLAFRAPPSSHHISMKPGDGVRIPMESFVRPGDTEYGGMGKRLPGEDDGDGGTKPIDGTFHTASY